MESEPQQNLALEAQLAATGLEGEAAFAALTAAEDAAGRGCGPCAMCCKLVGVAELDNAPGAACPHQLETAAAAECGGACSVHATRPGGCRVYACAWKLGLGVDAQRPDRVGALLEWLPFDDPDLHPYGGYWLMRIAGRRPSKTARLLIREQLDQGCVVLVHRGPEQRLSMFYPDGGEDAEAGQAPSWEDELRRGATMDFRVAYYESYADGLPAELRDIIETGRPPFES